MIGLSKTIIFATVMVGCALAMPNLVDANDYDSGENIAPFKNLGHPELDLGELQQEQTREKRDVCCHVNTDAKEAKVSTDDKPVLEEQHRAQRLARDIPCRRVNSSEDNNVIKVQEAPKPAEISAGV